MNSISIASLKDDERLATLFSETAKCAIELWLLQTGGKKVRSTRVVYGRVTPYRFADGRWNAPKNDSFKSIGGLEAQVVRVAAYVNGALLATFLQLLCEGKTLRDASQEAGLMMSPDFEERFGNVSLRASLLIRPPAHLGPREYLRDRTHAVSPHVSGGAVSASLVDASKLSMFDIDGAVMLPLAEFVLGWMQEILSLEVPGIDSWRLGDIELICFPTLDLFEKKKFAVKVTSGAIHVDVAATQHAGADEPTSYLVTLRILNNALVVGSRAHQLLAQADHDLKVELPLTREEAAICDAFEVSLYARRDPKGPWVYVDTRAAHLIREMHTGITMRQDVIISEWPWLDKALPQSAKDRADRLRRIERFGLSTNSVHGGRSADPWVPINRAMTSLAREIIPERSEARFFERLAVKPGRLELAEWLQETLSKYRNHEFIWFDPYMETAGIELIAAFAPAASAFLVVTTRPKQTSRAARFLSGLKSSFGIGATADKHRRRVDQLLSSCRRHLSALGGTDLRVIGLDPEKLHDRILLIRTAQGGPVKGFQLSNSIQRSNESYPFLVTPIPKDTLRPLFAYLDQLLAPMETGDLRYTVLFDSREHLNAATRLPTNAKREEPASFETMRAWWTSELGEGTDERSPLVENAETETAGLTAVPSAFLNGAWIDDRFSEKWQGLAWLLANSHCGEELFTKGRAFDQRLLEALENCLKSSSVELSGSDRYPDTSEVFSEAISDLLRRGHHPGQVLEPMPIWVTWDVYYAIKILWHANPGALTHWIETLPESPISPEQSRRLHTALAVIAGDEGFVRHNQRAVLLASRCDYLRWLAYWAMSYSLSAGRMSIADLDTSLSTVGRTERQSVYIWLIGNAARMGRDTSELASSLLSSADPKIDKAALKGYISASLGPTKAFEFSATWLFESVVVPFLRNGRLSSDVVASVWMEELIAGWKDGVTNRRKSFIPRWDGVSFRQLVAIAEYVNDSFVESATRQLDAFATFLERQIRQPMFRHVDQVAPNYVWAASIWARALSNCLSIKINAESELASHGALQNVARRFSDLANSVGSDENSDLWNGMVQFLEEVDPHPR